MWLDLEYGFYSLGYSLHASQPLLTTQGDVGLLSMDELGTQGLHSDSQPVPYKVSRSFVRSVLKPFK